MVRYILFLIIATNICCTLEEDITEYVDSKSVNSLVNFFSTLKKENINVPTGKYNLTPLVTVLSNYEDEDRATRKIKNERRANLVNIMLAIKGIDIETPGFFFKTPLWLACDAGNIPVVNRLKKSGANIKSISRMSPLELAYGCRVIDSEFDLDA
jgi:hypothetical protein